MRLINQKEFENLLDDLIEQKNKLVHGEKLSIKDFMQHHGFFPILAGINFAIPQKTVSECVGKNVNESMVTAIHVARRTTALNDLNFSGCQILDCNFDSCDLSGSSFEDQSIGGCSFNNTILNQTLIKRTRFQCGLRAKSCSFLGTSFDYSQLENVIFDQCFVTRTSFNFLQKFNDVLWRNSLIKFVSIVGGVAANNVTMCSNLSTDIEELTTDKLIKFDKVAIQNKQPAVLISWNNRMPGLTASLVEKMLTLWHLNPVRMDYCPMVNEEQLDKEINELKQLVSQKMEDLKIQFINKAGAKSTNETNELKKTWKKQKISFAMMMIALMREIHDKDPQRFPQMTILYNHAKLMFDQVDALLIPGGQDIDPRFYGKPLDPKTQLPKYSPTSDLSDARRDALEFSLIYIQQFASIPKPVCGICRGSQVVAVSYGGKMYQDIGDVRRADFFIEPLIINDKLMERSLLSTKNRLNAHGKQDTLNVIFLHHQGYNLTAVQGLKATASTKTMSEIIIDTVAEDLDQNICITQSHPEFAFDMVDSTQDKGTCSKVSALVANSIFGQFEARINAFTHSKLEYSTYSLFRTKK